MTQVVRGRVLGKAGFVFAELGFDAQILSLDPVTQEKDAPYILPGFIDTHVHGGGGADTMDGAEGVKKLARFHLEHGTTTLYPTTITNPWSNIIDALNGVKQVKEAAFSELPDIPGAHLEGPFISPQRLGAQPPNTLLPTTELLRELLELDITRLITLAPELEGATAAAQLLAKAGVRISIGHTKASYEEVEPFIQAVRDVGGKVGFTHLFNAMGGLSGREPGVVGAALSDIDAFAELIFDTHHVHRASFLAALAAKPDHLSLITDAIRACGMSDGQSELGGQTVFISEGQAKLADGTLAGSLLSLDQALRNAVEAGLSLRKASQLLSQTPANYMGLKDRGHLDPGKRADFLVLNQDLQLQEVYVAGRKVVG